MDYIPGKIHEKLQNENHFMMINDFVIVLCKERYNDTNIMNDEEFKTFEVKKGNIITIRLFKPDSEYDSQCYCYIENVITDDTVIDIKSESLVTYDFIKLNTDNKVLFEEADIQTIREIKIRQILN